MGYFDMSGDEIEGVGPHEDLQGGVCIEVIISHLLLEVCVLVSRLEG